MGWGVLRGGRQGEAAFSNAAGFSLQGSRSTSQRGRLTAAEEVLRASAAMQARRLPVGGLSSCSDGCAMRLLQAVHIHFRLLSKYLVPFSSSTNQGRKKHPLAVSQAFHADQHR